MSQENVELVRRAYVAVNERDQATLEEIIAHDIELRATGRLPDAGTVIRGREAVKDWWTELLAALDMRVEVDEYIDAGDAVVAVIRQTARGIASGVETTNRIVAVYRIRDGKLTRIDAYRNRREALEAAGLRG
jgi:ketosteroid isomerase-like protein